MNGTFAALRLGEKEGPEEEEWAWVGKPLLRPVANGCVVSVDTGAFRVGYMGVSLVVADVSAPQTDLIASCG